MGCQSHTNYFSFLSQGKKEEKHLVRKLMVHRRYQIREATTSAFIFCFSVSVHCGGDLTADSGVIQSPGFPARYPDNADCEWNIIANDGSRITLTFVDFKV